MSENHALEERLALMNNEISRYDGEMANILGLLKQRDVVILILKNHVANLEGLLAQGKTNVDERYILRSESDELI